MNVYVSRIWVRVNTPEECYDQRLMEILSLIMLKTCVTSDLYKEYVMWFKSNEYKYYWAHAVLSFYIKLKTAKVFL